MMRLLDVADLQTSCGNHIEDFIRVYYTETDVAGPLTWEVKLVNPESVVVQIGGPGLCL